MSPNIKKIENLKCIEIIWWYWEFWNILEGLVTWLFQRGIDNTIIELYQKWRDWRNQLVEDVEELVENVNSKL